MTTTTTRYRPINLAAWEVRAIIDGRKTQTRRVVKPQPYVCVDLHVGVFTQTKIDRHGNERHGRDVFGAYTDDGEWGLKCPFGQPGDHLFGRENWRPYWCDKLYACIQYKADGLKRKPDIQDENTAGWFVEMCDLSKDDNEPWRPSTQMPRWASRETLRIKSVRIERLQEISGPDCWAEGIESAGWDCTKWGSVTHCYRDLWEQANGPESWDANQFVWVIEHERITK